MRRGDRIRLARELLTFGTVLAVVIRGKVSVLLDDGRAMWVDANELILLED